MAQNDNKNNNLIAFEANINQIDKLIKIQVSKWSIKGLPYIDKDDVANMIRDHIFKKFHLYDVSRPLGNWLNKVISSKMKNILRDEFYKFQRPCLNCPHFGGGNECRLFGEVGDECGLYKKWKNEKVNQYNIELPLSQENHSNEINSMPFDSLDVEKQLEELKIKLKTKLSKNDYRIFVGLYLQDKTETEVAAELGYKINKTETSRQIKNVKANILNIVKEILKTEEMF